MNVDEEKPWPVMKRKQTGWEGWLDGEVHGQAIVNIAENGDDRCSGNGWVSSKAFGEFILFLSNTYQLHPLAHHPTTTPNFWLH